MTNDIDINSIADAYLTAVENRNSPGRADAEVFQGRADRYRADRKAYNWADDLPKLATGSTESI